MKLLKPLTVLSLSALLSVGAYAEPNKKTAQKAQPAKAQQQKSVAKPAAKQVAAKNTAKAPVKQLNADKSPSQASKTTAPVNNAEAKLAEFSKSIDLKFGGMSISQQNNQVFVNFSYVLQNKARRSIKNVHWVTNYIAGNQVILTQDVPLSFEQPIKPKQSLPLTFSVAWENLPAVAQQALTTQNAQISASFQAKSLTFSNNRKIVVE